jgi:hypothetical protein
MVAPVRPETVWRHRIPWRCFFVPETHPPTPQKPKLLDRVRLHVRTRHGRLRNEVLNLRGAYPNGETGICGVSGYTAGGAYPQDVAGVSVSRIGPTLALANTPPRFAIYPDIRNCIL